jgi:tetratricopeptide (TPR) repeat protein
MTAGFRLLACAALVAWQAAPHPTIQERLDRVKADLFSRTDRVSENIQELKQVLALDPRSADAHMLLGIAYATLGTSELKGEAIGELRQALELNPRLVEVRFYLARLYLDLGRPARARDELDAALAQTPGHPELLALLGEAERQLKNPRRAIEVTRQALQADSTFGPARYYLGLALLDAGQRDEGIKELEQIVRAGAPVADAYLSLGAAYLDAGRTDDAIAALNQGVRVEPARSELHIALARAYRTKGLLEKADAQLTLGRPPSAKASADRSAAAPKGASAASSDYPYQQVELDFYLERGLVKLGLGQLAAAAEAFKQVLALEPGHEAAARGLSEANRRLRAKKPGDGR